jgi:hypothetical protein
VFLCMPAERQRAKQGPIGICRALKAVPFKNSPYKLSPEGTAASLAQIRFLEDEESLMAAGATAGPPTSLRSGRDDNSVEAGIDATRQ